MVEGLIVDAIGPSISQLISAITWTLKSGFLISSRVINLGALGLW